MKRFFKASEVLEEQKASGERYLEFLRVPAMSVGLYTLPQGAEDLQAPHRQDEIYYVLSGRARMRIVHDGSTEDRLVTAGSIIYVEPNVEHRFHSIEEELSVLVVFAPAET